MASDNTRPNHTPHENPQSTLDWAYYVRQAAENLHGQYQDDQGERFSRAWTLVLSNAVTLHPDGTARVQSDGSSYHINGDCPCDDAQYRTKYCKHYLAVELHKIALDLMHTSQNHPIVPESPTSPQPSSSHWQVQEAPASCTLKFQVSGVDVLYTMRDVNDDALFARIKRILPRVQQRSQAAQENVPQCSIHGVPLKRYSKNGQVWWSHRTADGQWCRGEQSHDRL